MQTKGQLIYNDIVMVFALGVIIYDLSRGRDVMWLIILCVYLIIKQIMAHRVYFKLKNRFY